MELLKQLRIAVCMCLLLSIVTGVVYPALVTGIAQLVFPYQANGSVVLREQRVLGSALIGQAFTAPGYFWGRPSATTPTPYNSALSTGSNFALTSHEQREAVLQRVQLFQRSDPTNKALIPIDLVTASGSGLDPEISPLAARYQIARVAKTRQLAEAVVEQLVTDAIKPRWLGVLGEPRVNVLQLNLAVDALTTTETNQHGG